MELIGLFCLLVNKVNRLHDDCHLFHEIFCTGNGQDFTIIKWRDGYFLACVREEFGILHENPGFSANLAGVCFLS